MILVFPQMLSGIVLVLLTQLVRIMSLVGPRPLPVTEDRDCNQWHRIRRDVKPGVTCLWQISARNQSSFDDWVSLDIEYSRRKSPLLDLKIVLLTPSAVLSRRGAR